MRRLLDLPERPQAGFCFNDLLALGALRTALVAGLSVPGDLAIAGWDDIEDGRYSTPTLTTVSPDTSVCICTGASHFISVYKRNMPAALNWKFFISSGFLLMVTFFSVTVVF